MIEDKKIKELMLPRYKVIATYPFNDHFMLNEVIQLNEFDGREHLAKELNEWYVNQRPLNPHSDRLPLTMYESTFNLYPHLFNRLSWWEERRLEEMPEYVKCIKTPDQIILSGDVLKVDWFEAGDGKAENGPRIFLYTNCYLPATSNEYRSYQNQVESKNKFIEESGDFSLETWNKLKN